LDDLRIAGLSGIIGNPLKPFRMNELTFVKAIQNLKSQKPDIFIMHQDSDAMALSKDVTGHLIDATLGNKAEMLVICGHKYWEEPLRTPDNGIQILNVNERVVFLREE
jgi:hypothetical protein